MIKAATDQKDTIGKKNETKKTMKMNFTVILKVIPYKKRIEKIIEMDLDYT